MKKIKIHIVGMDERSCNTLSFFFQKFCQNRCEMCEEYTAQVFLINFDNVDAKKELARLKKSYPIIPVILTSIKPVSPEYQDYYFLRKPMIADQLVRIIDEITSVSPTLIRQKNHDSFIKSKGHAIDEKKASPLVHSMKREISDKVIDDKDIIAFVGKHSDIDLRLATKKEKNFFDLERYFLSYLQQAYHQAIAEDSVVKITGLWSTIFVFSSSNKIYIEMSDRQLKSICVVPLDSSIIERTEISMETVDASEAVRVCKKNQNYQSLDLFMWKIALWTSRGRLPTNIALDSPLYLLGWPNFTRLILTPEALRICAIWVPHPRTIINLAEVTAIPQRYLFALITACHVLGLSGLAHRKSDILILPSGIEPTKEVSLFSRMMKKLKN